MIRSAIYGIDIGGTKIELAAFDPQMRPVHRQRAVTPANDYAHFIDVIVEMVETADFELGTRGEVGVGIPGLIDRDKRSHTSNLPGANGRTIHLDLASRLDRRVVADNDCRCFALSEAIGGAGSGYRVVLGTILGTGAASGMVVDGKLTKGRARMAVENGHLPLSAAVQQRYALPLLECGCGLTGCVECYIAGPGLITLSRHFGADAASPASLAKAWRTGDPASISARECFLDILGSVFADMIKLFDPEIIVMGGGLSLIDDVVTMLPASMQQHLFPGFDVPPVVRAKFGDASGVRGAALLLREETVE